MNLKSLIAPVAIAGLLAFGTLPASAALFDGARISFQTHHDVNLSSLTPAQRTQLEDQCRRMQSDTFSNGRDKDAESSAPFRANAADCAAIGLPA
jgi:hypothetical protein